MFRTMQSVSFEISGFPAYGFHVGSWYVAFVVEAFPTAGLSHTELRSPASALVYVLDVSINQIRLLSDGGLGEIKAVTAVVDDFEVERRKVDIVLCTHIDGLNRAAIFHLLEIIKMLLNALIFYKRL